MATTTAAEKRERAKSAYNAFLAVCPSRQLLDRLADKWVVLILCALGGDGTGSVGEPASMRYSELSRLIAGVSQKMLTQTLRELERDGIVHRTVHPEVPVRVEYRLTESGESLRGPLRALEEWSIEHLGSVLADQERYDRRGTDT